jgi:hypothetical protein
MVRTRGVGNILPKTQVLGLPGFRVLGNPDRTTDKKRQNPEDLFGNILMLSVAIGSYR